MSGITAIINARSPLQDTDFANVEDCSVDKDDFSGGKSSDVVDPR